jgi:hypothetical protein
MKALIPQLLINGRPEVLSKVMGDSSRKEKMLALMKVIDANIQNITYSNF